MNFEVDLALIKFLSLFKMPEVEKYELVVGKSPFCIEKFLERAVQRANHVVLGRVGVT